MNNKMGQDKEQDELFQVPEGYFEQLPDRIMMRIHQEAPLKIVHSGSADGVQKTVIKLFAYAASIAAVFLVSIGISNYFHDGTKSLAATLTANEIIESGVLYDMDESLLAEHLTTEDLDDVVLTIEDEDAITEYLIERQTDLTPLEF